MSTSKNPSTMNGLKTMLEEDTEMLEKMKDDPIAMLDQIAREAIPDTRVYRIVVASLGVALMVTLIGAATVVLVAALKNASLEGFQLPSIFPSVATGIVGALAGLLAPQR